MAAPTKTCPLCKQSRKARAFLPLYRTPVCRKCAYGFANRRQFAWVLDWVLYYVIAVVILFGIDAAVLAITADVFTSTIVQLVAGWIILPNILFLRDVVGGRSPGKRLMGLTTIDVRTYKPIGPLDSWKRNLPLIIPFVPLIVALRMMKGPRLGDRWAHARVIWDRYARHPVFLGTASCLECGYDLSGAPSGACPECGTPYTPSTDCRNCGYSLIGNSSDQCPECGVSSRIPATPPLA